MVVISTISLEESSFSLSLANSASAQYLPKASGCTSERERLAARFTAAEGAIVGVTKLCKGREALPMQPTFRPPERRSFRRGTFSQGGTCAMQDQLDITSILAPGVQRGHRALMRG